MHSIIVALFILMSLNYFIVSYAQRNYVFFLYNLKSYKMHRKIIFFIFVILAFYKFISLSLNDKIFSFRYITIIILFIVQLKKLLVHK